MERLPALTFSKSAHLPWPYDLGLRPDRDVLAALEKARWLVWCARLPAGERATRSSR